MNIGLIDADGKFPEQDYVLCSSHGKDSLATLRAIEFLKWPLTRIVHVEVWATKDIPAELPPMVEFKKKADAIIKERWGIEVEHISADVTFEEQFYKVFQDGKNKGRIYGWPFLKGPWCNSRLKMEAINKIKINGIEYIGLAADEPKRFKVLSDTKLSPLKELGWEEDLCGLWCKYNDLLSPTYNSSCRGGCWFCHNQGVQQLRLLRKDYPQYWELMLKWDKDSPVSFKPDGRTVHDFDRRFQAEDEGLISPDKYFRWDMLDKPLQFSIMF